MLAAAIVVFGVAHIAFPGGIALSMISVCLLISAFIGRPRVTLALVALAFAVATIVLALTIGWTTTLEGRFVELAVASAVAIAGALLVDRWRSQLRREEDSYRLLAENTMDMVFTADLDDTITWAASSVQAVLGFTPAELIGSPYRELLHEDDQPFLREARLSVDRWSSKTFLARYRTASGETRWMETTPRPLRDDDGTVTGLVAAVRDVNEEVLARQALEREVSFDGLTGLARRSVALARIDEILQSRDDRDWALLCMGIDGLTAVNNAFTHTGGDLVLKAVADRLTEAVGTHDRIARVAGDEFVVIAPYLNSAPAAAQLSERLIAAVNGPLVIGTATVIITGCVGIAMSSGQDAEELLRDATAAMRDASRKGADRWVFSDGSVGARTRDDLVLLNSLRDALAGDGIVPWFMPIVTLPDGIVTGYEAVARWMHADGTITMPESFVPVAEASGLMPALDRRVFRQILQAVARDDTASTYAFNVTGVSLAAGDLADWVADDLRSVGVDPSRLHFEVTETSLFYASEALQRTMTELAALGITWWVDDFGTGYSSISHLRDLPIAGLKLDKSFTAGVSAEDTHSTRLANGLFGLAHGLGLQTVVEGIETVEQAQVMAEQGWQMGQGWLYGKATPRDLTS
jgi:PAS domain S-box-containing protein/diguanylate cyclase (GGDEF)-like protein